MKSPSVPNISIALVGDLQVNSQAVHEAAQLPVRTLHIVATARDALQLARTQSIDYWLICQQLPDENGLACIEMLQEISSRARFCLIDQQYTSQYERRAFQIARTVYVSHPIDPDWLGCLFGAWRKADQNQQEAASSAANVPSLQKSP